MSRRGNCWDNVVQDRFFRNLKFEYLDDLVLLNHHAAQLAVERYIRYYNNIRLNSAIEYKTPLQKRKELQKKQAKKDYRKVCNGLVFLDISECNCSDLFGVKPQL